MNRAPLFASNPDLDSFEELKVLPARKSCFRILAGMDLTGSLSSDILSLSELQYLDLSNNKGLTGTLPSLIGNLNQLTTLILIGCSFFGPIPDSIGSLQQLVFFIVCRALNANNFSGPIPPSIGNLSNLSWLDLTENQLNGTIPVSSGSTTGLDMLVKARHFKIFYVNKLTGSIPDTLGYAQTLEAICFNWNSLNGPVPSNLNNLTSVRELYLSNNNLNGPSPNLTGMNFLNSLDMNNNSFNSSADHPWHTSLEALTTLLVFDDVWKHICKSRSSVELFIYFLN